MFFRDAPVVFADLEGTIATSFVVAPQLADDISFLRDNKGVFVINTGLPSSEFLKTFARKLNADFLITSNGMLAETPKGEIVFSHEQIDIKTLKAFVSFSRQHNLCLLVTTKHKRTFHLNNNSSFCKYLLEIGQKHPILNTFNFPEELWDHKVKTIELRSSMLPNVAKELDLLLSSTLMLATAISLEKDAFEISPQPTNKGVALQRLCFILESNHRQSMVIGDSSNDLSMFAVSDFSYAMANADWQVKHFAKFHTSRVEQNGVGEAIKDYLYRRNGLVPKKPKVL